MERGININTDQVTIIKGSNWNNITKIDFSGSNVYFDGIKTAYSPFSGTNITELVNGTITNGYVYKMFNGCKSLKTFKCNFVDVHNEVNDSMFYGCSALTTFESNLSLWKNGYEMFRGCKSLSNFKTDNFDNLEQGYNMFQGTNINSFNYKLPKLTNGQNMFSDCKNLSTFNSDLSNLTNGQGMFSDCSSITSFNAVSLENLQNGRMMFYGVRFYNINLKLPNLTNGSYMFTRCTSLSSFSGDLSSLSDGYGMFSGCTSLKEFTTDMPNLMSGNSMFQGCTKLSSFTSDLGNVKDSYGMFSGCTSLKTFYADLHSMTTSSSTMLSKCSALTEFSAIIPKSQSGWTRTQFGIPTSTLSTANRYCTDLGNGNVCLTYTTKKRRDAIYDGKITDNEPIANIDCTSNIKNVSECFEGSALTSVNSYLSKFGYNATKAYIVFIDGRKCSLTGLHSYRLNFSNRDTAYGLIVVMDTPLQVWFDTYVDDVLIYENQFTRNYPTAFGFSNTSRDMSLTTTASTATILMPNA